MEVPDRVKISVPVFAYLKPTIFFMRSFGLAPISYGLVKKHYIVERSTKYTIYSFIMIIFFGSMTLLGLLDDANADNSIRMKLKRQKVIVMSDIGIVLCSVLFGVFMSPYKVDQLLNIFRCLNKINMEMNESTEQMKREKRVALTIGLTVYGIFIAVFALDIFVWFGRCESTREMFSYLMDYSFFYVLYLVVMSQELSFCNFTYYIKKRIMALNEAIYSEILRKPEVFLLKRTSGKAVDSSVTSKLIIDNVGDALENHVLKNNIFSPIEELIPERISSLLKVHSLIFTAVKSINDCFGYPLLFIMTSCLLHLTVTPFFLITGPQKRPLFSLLQVIWIIVHLGRLLIIVEPTHRCIKEYEKTNPLIIHLLSQVENEEVKQKLEVFAIQGNLCVIQFSPCGIVTIRRSMLASIASAVTTYLVIMIQLGK